MTDPRYLVLLNAIHAKSGGGRTYLEEVAPRLSRIDPEVHYRVVARPEQADGLSRLGCEVLPVRAPAGPLGSLVWVQAALPLLARRQRADAVFTPANFGPWLLGRRSVILLRNTPEAASSSRRLSRRVYWAAMSQVSRLSVRTARGGIVVSRTFRDYVSARYHVPPDRLEVVHHGISGLFRPEPDPGEERLRPAGPYLLLVSHIHPHKNVPLVLEAFASVAAGRPDLRLVIAGKELDGAHAAELRRRAARPDLDGRVLFLGNVPLAGLPSLYRGAEAALFLSLAETFGIPQLEAMACGTPLVASDLPFAREVAAEAALYVSPFDATEMAAALRRVLGDEALARELRTRGLLRAREFSWDDAARKTHQVIKRRIETLPQHRR